MPSPLNDLDKMEMDIKMKILATVISEKFKGHGFFVLLFEKNEERHRMSVVSDQTRDVITPYLHDFLNNASEDRVEFQADVKEFIDRVLKGEPE